MITVRFPAMLHARAGQELTLDESPSDIGSLLDALDAHVPGLARELADPIYNFAVNDEMLLHGVRNHPLESGDVVEIVPTISGGSHSFPRHSFPALFDFRNCRFNRISR